MYIILSKYTIPIRFGMMAIFLSIGLLVLPGTAFADRAFKMDTTPSYEAGIFGQALRVDQTDVPVYDFSGFDGLNPTAGTIEAWVKPIDWTSDTNAYWEILSGVNQDGQDMYEFRRGKDQNIDVLQFIAYTPSGSFQAWRTSENFTWSNDQWYHLAVTWSEEQSPRAFVNGTMYKMIPAYGETTWSIRNDFSEGGNYLGQRGNKGVRNGSGFNHSGRAVFDEVRVSNIARSTDDIIANYNGGVGIKLTVDKNTLWLAHFDGSLKLAKSHIAEGTSFFSYDSKIRGGFNTDTGNVLGDSKEEIITGTGKGMGPHVRVFNNEGNLKAQFFAYDSKLRFGVVVSACDIDGNGTDEIITAQGSGGWPLVKIFSGNGEIINNGFLVLDGKFLGGVNLSCGDTNGDGTDEIVVAAQRGGGPQVMVYNANGKILTNFMAYAPNFRGGISIGTADADGDGKDEIITGPQYGVPHVQIFQIRSNELKRLSPGFFPFGTAFRGGISVSGVDTNGDGIKEIVVGVGGEMAPMIKVYNIREVEQTSLYAYASTFMGGVQLSGGDVDGDGIDELIVIPRGGGGPQIRVIDIN